MKFSDSHAHYSSKKFDKDRNELLKRLFEEDVKYIIECGTNTHWNNKVLELCNNYENMYAVIGYCPVDVAELKSEQILNKFKKLLISPKVVGLGEIGLDYYHSPKTKEEQIKYFEMQLDLAHQFNLPVCIHSRQAEEDTLSVLKNANNKQGVIHCYAYGTKTMQELCNLGYYFGVGGTSTYLNNTELREAIKEMPLERIVLETDAPYLTPNIVRKERNDSSKIIHVIKELSLLKNISEKEIIEQTTKNIITLYPKINKKDQ